MGRLAGAPAWWQRAAVPVLLALALHARSLRSGFSFDDRAAVKDNPDVADAARPLRFLLQDDFWGAPVAGELSHKSWRPATVGAWRAIRAAELYAAPPGAPPAMGARAFHALNVVLHAGVTAQVHALALALARWEVHPAPFSCAAAAALLFATHPVHVEAVAGLVGAAELLSALFALAALRLYLSAALTPSRVFLRLVGAALCIITAALAKETGLTVLGACVALEWLLRADTRSARSAVALRLFIVAAAGGAYLAARRAVLGPHMVTRPLRIADNHLAFLPTRTAAALSVAHSHWRYIYLLLWPATLCADWNYACIPPVTRWGDPRNTGAIALYAAAVVILLLARPWRGWSGSGGASRAAQLRLFHAAALGVAPLVPAANVVVFIGAYLAERLLYSPSVGFCMAVAASATRSAPGEPLPRRRLRFAALALLIGTYAGRTAYRLPAWDDDDTLFALTAATCPDGARARFNAGIRLREAGRCAEAVPHFEKALQVLPADCGPMYGMGHCAHSAGRLGEAAAWFEKALECVETAQSAGEAVRKTLAALHSEHPGEPEVLLAYARVIRKLDAVAGDDEACAAAGHAARLLAEAGQTKRAAAAEALCPRGRRAARAAAAVPGGLLAAGSCDSASPAAVAEHAAAAEAQRPGIAIAFVRRMGAACRGNGAYLRAVNALQTADPMNPVLHWEWARLLRLQLGRDEEAEKHAAFAVTVFDAHAKMARDGGAEAEARAAEHEAKKVKAEMKTWRGVKAGPPARLADAHLEL